MSAQTKPLLVELRTEEMPPLLLDDVAAGFADNFVKALADARLCEPNAESENWSTPKRIAVLVHGVAAKRMTTSSLRRGPSVKNAYHADGKPTPALSGFLRSNGAKRSDLQVIEYKNEPYVAVPQSDGGEPLGKLLGSALERAAARTVAPRLMRWGNNDHRFVRPIQGIYAVHGKRLVKAEAFGESTLNHSIGHRFLAPRKIQIKDATDYIETLREFNVLVVAEDRRKTIRRQAHKLSPKVRIDKDLLHEVANMCEWPQCYQAKFDHKYKRLPEKVIETCMGKHLRSFAVGDSELENKFIFVADNRPSNSKILQHGLERVMRARLDDTLFIYDQDRKINPDELLKRLDNINYLQGMGSMRQRCERIEKIAEKTAYGVRVRPNSIKDMEKAAQYIKADLSTLLIDEYPSLEGQIGASLLESSLSDTACDLIRNHMDRSQDINPGPARDALILALELERLATMSATEGLPKGSRDPLALRRSMSRVMRILHRNPWIYFDALLKPAWEECKAAADQNGALKAGLFNPEWEKLSRDLKRFAIERLINMASDLIGKGVARRTLNAVHSATLRHCEKDGHLDVADIMRRIEDLHDFINDDPLRFKRLLAVAKRLNNIDDGKDPGEIDESLFLSEEQDLIGVINNSAIAGVQTQKKRGHYKYFCVVADDIAPYLDRFFKNIRVHDKDPVLRENRLNIIRTAARMLNYNIDTRKLYA